MLKTIINAFVLSTYEILNLPLLLKLEKRDVTTTFWGISLLVLVYGIIQENKMRCSYWKVVKKITLFAKDTIVYIKNAENYLKKIKMYFIIEGKKINIMKKFISPEVT